MFLHTTFFLLALLSINSWAEYVLEDDYFAGPSFFDQFSFFTDADPTHGFVSYVDLTTAQDQNLISANGSQAWIGVDHTSILPNGRTSVRLTGKKTYNTGLIILDLQAMPGGVCGTWPAFWMVGSDWPRNGEIDIIEGVHEQTANDMTLHTDSGCVMSSGSTMTGQMMTSNCDVSAAGQAANQGCQVVADDAFTYGSGFNQGGGGVYATEVTQDAIRIYFFSRKDIPIDIVNGAPTPSSWNIPVAEFTGACDIPEHFRDLQIVFDTTFCGDWAGAVWDTTSCSAMADSCQEFVANNPAAFTEVYWLVNSLKVYSLQPGNASTNVGPSDTMTILGQESDMLTSIGTSVHSASIGVAHSSVSLAPDALTSTAAETELPALQHHHHQRQFRAAHKRHHVQSGL